MATRDWAALDGDIQSITAASSKPYDQNTVSQSREFLNRIRDGFAIPTISRGYWETICFNWDTRPPIQIEVFADRFEFYLMPEGRMDIQYFPHKLGEPIPLELLAKLPAA